MIYWNKIIVIIQQFLFLGMTAPCEILEYELHLTLEQIKEEPVDNADSTQVRICRNRNKYFYLLNAHPWNNVWLLAWLQILSQHVWKKNFYSQGSLFIQLFAFIVDVFFGVHGYSFFMLLLVLILLMSNKNELKYLY